MKHTIAIVAVGLLCVPLAACSGSAGATSGGGGSSMNDAAQAAHDALPTGMPEAAARAAGLGTDGAPVVMVTATDTTCRPNASRIGAGKTWFEIKNTGSKITELYLEKADTTELIQVERIRSGQSGAFATTVAAGNYLLACEPGMAGHNTQIRSSLTVG